MQDLIQETARGIAIPVASYSSAHTNEWVCMENHAKITFTVFTGAVCSSGLSLMVRAAPSKSGSSAETLAAPWDGGVFYKHTTTTAPTVTAVTSSTSIEYMVVGSSINAVYYATVDASKLPATKPYVTLAAKANSASSCLIAATFEAWGTRYQQEVVLDVLA
jgi:hypothetical protein